MHALFTLFFLFAMFTPVLSGNLSAYNASAEEEEEVTEKIDDWQFDQQQLLEEKRVSKGAQSRPGTGTPPVVTSAARISKSANFGAAKASAPQSIGFAVGGAKDTVNFSQNLNEGYLPKYDSITYEGLYYDYYFATGIGEGECDALFCPSFAKAITRDLYSGETNYYLSVGLNSGLTEQRFQRKQLNLVIVVDISGSMGSRFDKYYYDRARPNSSKEDENKSKMQIANESIVAMMKHLADGDRFGVILFDNQAYRAKPLRLVRHTDMEAIAKHVLELHPQGGTNWKAGYDEGVKMIASMKTSTNDSTIHENRIIFVTDAMPNTGELSKEGLFGMVRDASKSGIYTSFIGVGIDFNPQLVEHVTKTRGANYFAVHSSTELKKRLADEFDFMVTPLVFDLELQVESDRYTIDGVFGSPEADLATGEVMKINTLFPSPMEAEAVKGGVVLVKLKKTASGNHPINLTVRYQDRAGKQFENTDTVAFTGDNPGFDNKGIRKAVLLTEYVSLVKNWLLDARKGCNDQVERPVLLPLHRCGLINPDIRPEVNMLSTWERKSCPLDVSPGYRKFFSLFGRHFDAEMQIIGDPTLEKERKVLQQLTAKGSKAASPETTGPIDDWEIKN